MLRHPPGAPGRIAPTHWPGDARGATLPGHRAPKSDAVRRYVPDERIQQVVEQVGLGDWLAACPRDWIRPWKRARGLSAGEAQLLAFARVFLADPGLVILDEASSRLDPATEQRIEKAVDRLLANRTGIIIAHRLGTVQRADEIMILEDGRIAEHGPRAELASDPDSRFYRLLQTGLEEVMA